MDEETHHFECPFCTSHDVSRMYLASVNLDSCECVSCGARWEQDATTGAYRGRASRSSVMLPRRP